MVVSRSHEDAWKIRGKLMMGNNNFIPLQDSVNIIDVEVDSRLLLDRGPKSMAIVNVTASPKTPSHRWPPDFII